MSLGAEAVTSEYHQRPGIFREGGEYVTPLPFLMRHAISSRLAEEMNVT